MDGREDEKNKMIEVKEQKHLQGSRPGCRHVPQVWVRGVKSPVSRFAVVGDGEGGSEGSRGQFREFYSRYSFFSFLFFLISSFLDRRRRGKLKFEEGRGVEDKGRGLKQIRGAGAGAGAGEGSPALSMEALQTNSLWITLP